MKVWSPLFAWIAAAHVLVCMNIVTFLNIHDMYTTGKLKDPWFIWISDYWLIVELWASALPLQILSLLGSTMSPKDARSFVHHIQFYMYILAVPFSMLAVHLVLHLPFPPSPFLE